MKQRNRTRTATSAPIIAVIGCGAIAEAFHLPAIARNLAVRDRLILVDPDIERTRNLASHYSINEVCGDYQDVLDKIDGAIIAVPHHLHYPIALNCLRNAIPVLCEKPLAETCAQVAELVYEAQRAGVTISVNNNRRLFPSFRRVRQLIAAGEIGRTQFIEMYHGEKFDWPSATASYFGARSGGKGVLLDTGVHVLDLVCWWLGGKPRVVSYVDDSFGGSEAVAKLSFEHGTCRGSVHLSWLSRLQNLYRIHGELATIEVGVYDWESFTVIPRSGSPTRIRVNSAVRRFSDVANVVLDNFVDVLRSGQEPLVTGRDVALSVELIDECYAARSRFEMPWHETFLRITNGF